MTTPRPLHWVGSSKEDLMTMPDDIRSDMGFALYLAQIGMKSPDAKHFKGMGSGVLEVVESDKDGTYRAVYTVRLEHAVYVLHCFQKKSTRGIKTSQRDIEIIRNRLRAAETYDGAQQ